MAASAEPCISRVATLHGQVLLRTLLKRLQLSITRERSTLLWKSKKTWLEAYIELLLALDWSLSSCSSLHTHTHTHTHTQTHTHATVYLACACIYWGIIICVSIAMLCRFDTSTKASAPAHYIMCGSVMNLLTLSWLCTGWNHSVVFSCSEWSCEGSGIVDCSKSSSEHSKDGEIYYLSVSIIIWMCTGWIHSSITHCQSTGSLWSC